MKPLVMTNSSVSPSWLRTFAWLFNPCTLTHAEEQLPNSMILYDKFIEANLLVMEKIVLQAFKEMRYTLQQTLASQKHTGSGWDSGFLDGWIKKIRPIVILGAL